MAAGESGNRAGRQGGGRTIYVDSRLGNDRFDGRAQAPEGDTSGPVQSLAAAARRAGSGDSIVLANRGTPYYGSLTLFRSATQRRRAPAVYDLRERFDTERCKANRQGCWQHVTGDIWRVTRSTRRTISGARRRGGPFSGLCDPSSKMLPEIAKGEWCAWRGAVYFHAPAGVNPDTMSLSLADQQVGITLLDVDKVVSAT